MKKTACPLAAARGKERASQSKNRGKGKGKKNSKGKSKDKNATDSAKNKKKPPKAKARAGSPTRVKPYCGQRLTQGAPCSTACCAKGLLQTCKGQRKKKSRVGRLFVSLLKNARAADILHLKCILRILDGKCLCRLPSLVRFRRLVFLVWFTGRSSGVLFGITSLMCGTPLLCRILNSSQPRFGGNCILGVKPRVFRSI